MKKKSLIGLRIFLALILCGVIGGFYVNASAYDEYDTSTWNVGSMEESVKSRSSQKNGVYVTKSARWDNDEKDVAEVTISVSAYAKTEKKPFFIFMVDHSVSLDTGTGVNRAIEEARTLFTEYPDARVAVVNFAGEARASNFAGEYPGFTRSTYEIEQFIMSVDSEGNYVIDDYGNTFSIDKSRTNFTKAMEVLQNELLSGLDSTIQPIVIWFTDGAPVYPDNRNPGDISRNTGVMFPEGEKHKYINGGEVDYYYEALKSPDVDRNDAVLNQGVDNLKGYNEAKQSVQAKARMYVDLLDGDGGSFYANNPNSITWIPLWLAIDTLWHDVPRYTSLDEICKEACPKESIRIVINDEINHDLFTLNQSTITRSEGYYYLTSESRIQWIIERYEKPAWIKFKLNLKDKSKDGWINTNYIKDYTDGAFSRDSDVSCNTIATFNSTSVENFSTRSPWLYRTIPIETSAEIVKSAHWVDSEQTQARIRIEVHSSATRAGLEVTNVPIGSSGVWVMDLINYDLFKCDKSIQNINSNINKNVSDYGMALFGNSYYWSVYGMNYGQKVDNEWPYVEFTIALKDEYKNYVGYLNTNYISNIEHDGTKKDNPQGDDAATLMIDGKIVDEEKSPWLNRDVKTEAKIVKTAEWVDKDNCTMTRIRLELQSSAKNGEGKSIENVPIQGTIRDIINYDLFRIDPSRKLL